MLAAGVRGLLPVHELIPIETPRPAQCGSICGFATLRGRDVPVVDLRGKFGIASGSNGRQPCVVVVEGTAGRLVGFVADCVSEVLQLGDRDFRNGSVRVISKSNRSKSNRSKSNRSKSNRSKSNRTPRRARRVLDPDEILTEEEFLSCWNAAFDAVTAFTL